MDWSAMNLSDWLSLLALVVSIFTFVWVEIKEWRRRPQLNIFLRIITFVSKANSEKEDMVNILLINDGYSPIIISECKYYFTDSNGEGSLGIYDELKAPYGVHEIVLPALLQPADKLSLNFLRVQAINKIKKIVLIDSHGKQYAVPENELNHVKHEYQRRFASSDSKSS